MIPSVRNTAQKKKKFGDAQCMDDESGFEDKFKESIDLPEMKRLAQEDWQISKDNVSKIEEPLIYKTMAQAIDSHYSYLHN